MPDPTLPPDSPPDLPPDLPPDRSLDEETKARMRAALTEHSSQPDTARGAPGWLVPAVAAAAVVCIVAVGVGLVSKGGDEGARQPTQPLGSGTANDPAVPSTAPPGSTPSAGASTGASSAPPSVRSPSKGTSTHPWGPPKQSAVSCAEEVPSFLDGATELSSIGYAGGTVALFGTGSKWIVCDDWAATSDGGAPTLIGGSQYDAPLSKDLVRISENYSLRDAHVAQFVAAGPLIDGVKSISYEFPDGHTEKATMNDKMWAMAYLPTTGPLVGAGRAPGSIGVSVTHDDGTADDFRLQWGLDTCTQVNHGC